MAIDSPMHAWEVRAFDPEIGTTNATDNAPMLSINERMGFVRTIEVVQYEIGRDDLAAWLEAR
ncbi:MAG: hypothetical protein ABFS86_01045 [Planctomycetota bacterium]